VLPWISFVILPIFALANAGVRLSASSLRDAVTSRVALGVILGLVVGKTVGISIASWLAVRMGLGRLPAGVGWSHLVGTAAVAGIGFTVSLFVTELAFGDPGLAAAAKVGILVGSIVAGLVGFLLLRRAPAAAEGEALGTIEE
jgi:NhaA family Na+:H+ antiporter